MAANKNTTQITQAAEKENPGTFPLNEKIMDQNNSLQALAGTSDVDGNPQKLQRGDSLKSAIEDSDVFKSKINVPGAGSSNNIQQHRNKNDKVPLRDVGNVKNCIKTDQANGAGKKSTVGPVQQLNAFSIYEDQNENEEQLATGAKVGVNKRMAQETHISTVQTEFEKSMSILEFLSPFSMSLDPSANAHNGDKEQQQKLMVVSEEPISGDNRVTSSKDVSDWTMKQPTEVLSPSPMSLDRSVNPAHLFDLKERAKLLYVDKTLQRNSSQILYDEVSEYQYDILKHLFESQKKHRPKPEYMSRQTDITYSMRTILVDWLVEVTEEYMLQTETLYLAVSYIDRFLSRMSVLRSKLQLVGTTALYIASKYEEIYPPNVSEFVFITDDTYNKEQVLRMERIILKVLAFDLCTPTAYMLVNAFVVRIGANDKVKFLTLYLTELSLLEADPYIGFDTSMISAAALALARHLCGMPIWSAELQEITSYRLEDLKTVLLCLCRTHNAAVSSERQAIQEKYKADKFQQVSTIEPVVINGGLFEKIAEKFNQTMQKQKRQEEQQQNAAAMAENAFN